MKTSRLQWIVAVALSVAPLMAGGLSRDHRDWPNSPQGYFMTAAERAQWKSVATDADAEKFIAQFVAARTPDFTAEVAKRAEMADKYMTVGKTKGSLSTRGRVVILLGPPASMNISQRVAQQSRSAAPSQAGESSGGFVDRGPTVSAMAGAAVSADRSGSVVHDYAFMYPKDKLPAGYGKELMVVVEVSTSTGQDRIVDRQSAAEFESLAEAVATSAFRPAPAAKP